jgi:signal peptidase I
MTSSFDDLPPRTGRPRQTEASDPPQDEGPRFTEDALWAPDGSTSVAATTAANPQASIDAISADGASDLESGSANGDPFAMTDEDIEAQRKARGQRARRVFWEVAQTLVLAAVIFFMVRGVAQNFRVEGPSMEPGLHDGQYLLVNKAVYFKLDLGELSKYIPFIGDDGSKFLFHGPQRGDVIVFRYPRDPSRDFIKRVIGVPGDVVSIHDGKVAVNGLLLDESYLDETTRSDLDDTVVPDGSYFVLGDNRSNSSDSRSWGFVPEENIIGKAMFSYWPLSELGGVGNSSIDLGFVKLPLP